MNIDITPTPVNVRAGPQAVSVSTGVPVVKEYVGAEPYRGAYVVIPEVGAQVLPTLNQRMTDNLTVTGVPYYEVSNESGLTVFIAETVNDD